MKKPANNKGTISPLAVIDPAAELHESVSVGPFSVIGADVKVGANTRIDSHVVISGPTTIGSDNRFHPFSSIGGEPQDKKYDGEPTRLEIGNGNTIHEYVTMSRGTVQDVGVTRIGNDNWIMAYVHFAHDCQIGNNCIFANAATMAGHVHIGDWAILGGMSKIHQFCRVGAHAFVGMDSAISQDVLPYVLVGGTPVAARGLNSEGLRRRGFTPEQLRGLKQAYRKIFRSSLRLEEAVTALQDDLEHHPEWQPMLDFIADSTRGITR